MENRNEVISYDYRTIKVRRENETMATDAYANLGWQFVGSSFSEGSIFSVNLSFKRDRKIEGKQKLLKQQEQADRSLQSIERLQNEKKTAGNVPALTTGIIGSLILGGGMATVMEFTAGSIGLMIGGIALGVVGLGICGLAWLVYKKVRSNRHAKLVPLLEDEYNRLADICEVINE